MNCDAGIIGLLIIMFSVHFMFIDITYKLCI